MASSALHCFETTIAIPLMTLPLRCIAVKHADKLIVISPIKFDDQQVARLRSLGGITDIVAPNMIHHLSVKHAKALFPKATVWAAPGLREKIPDLPIDKLLTTAAWPYGDVLRPILLEGCPSWNEIVFIHKPERTLIAIDFVFNIHNQKGVMAKTIQKILGTYDRFAVSRLTTTYVKDKDKFRASVAQVMASDFDRVMMTHGDIVESGGKPLLKEALRARGY